MSGTGKIDIRMGGRFRDRDESVSGTPGGNDALKQYIQELISKSEINWTQIIGAPTTNTELKQYIDSIVELISYNQFEADQAITQQMIDYFNTLNAQLTDVFNQIAALTSVNNEFKTYIDNEISNLETYIDSLVIGDNYTTELKQYIDDSIANLNTVLSTLIQSIQSTVTNELINYIRNELNLKGEATRLISGSVTWIDNLNFLVSPLVYQILNQRAESPETLVTIPANAANNPRFAVIYADIFGKVGYILGAAAANPAVPLVNDATQIRLTTIYIAALGTAPGTDPTGEAETIVNTIIYDENIEWQSAKTEEAGVNIDLADTSAPAHGAKNIKVVIVGAAGSVLKSALIAAAAANPAIRQTYAATGPEEEIILSMTSLFPDHKTDYVAAGVRHLVYYRVNTKNSITAKLVNTANGNQIPLRLMSFSGNDFSVPAIGFSAPATDSLTLTNHLVNIPAGTYTLNIEGVVRYDQQYTVTAASNLTPTAAKVTLTAPAPVDMSGGKLVLSLKTSAAWLANTGLLIELYNGSAKVGSLPIAPGSLQGFNPANIYDYQRLTLPVSLFGTNSVAVDKVLIAPVNAWPNCSFYIDYILLQKGAASVIIDDKFVESVALDALAKVTMKRTGGLKDLVLQFGTMALKKYWFGTQAVYDAIAVKDAETIYMIPVAEGDIYYTSPVTQKYAIPDAQINGVITDDETGARTGTATFALPADIDTTKAFFVFVGGLLRSEVDDYTFTLTQITFTAPPLAGNKIIIEYTPKV